MVTAKTAYHSLIRHWGMFSAHWWYSAIWKWKMPVKVQCFLWQALMGKLKTWENLMMKGWTGTWVVLSLPEQRGDDTTHSCRLWVH